MRLPEFFGIGPGRAGTTWLHNVLVGHVGFPRVKETQFFDNYYANGIEWYARLFRHCDPNLPIGEISPCFGHNKARERLHHHMPSCKLICTLRDPYERALSHFKLARCRGYITCDFETALDKHKIIVEHNRYAYHLKRWQEMFGKERVLLTFNEDMREKPQEYLDSICDYIGIGRFPIDKGNVPREGINHLDTGPRGKKLAQNARHLRRRLKSIGAYRTFNFLGRIGFWNYCFSGGEPFAGVDAATERRVRDRFRPEVEALEEMLGRDLSTWKTVSAKGEVAA